MSLRVAGGRIVCADYDCWSPPDLAAEAARVADLPAGTGMEEVLRVNQADFRAALGDPPCGRQPNVSL